MRQILSTIVFFMVLLLTLGITGWYECHYTLDCEVIEVNDEYSVFVDKAGEEWEWTNEDDDEFIEGDRVELTMFDNHTHTMKDDEIEKVVITD